MIKILSFFKATANFLELALWSGCLAWPRCMSLFRLSEYIMENTWKHRTPNVHISTLLFDNIYNLYIYNTIGNYIYFYMLHLYIFGSIFRSLGTALSFLRFVIENPSKWAHGVWQVVHYQQLQFMHGMHGGECHWENAGTLGRDGTRKNQAHIHLL